MTGYAPDRYWIEEKDGSLTRRRTGRGCLERNNTPVFKHPGGWAKKRNRLRPEKPEPSPN